MLEDGYKIINEFMSVQDMNSILSEIDIVELPMLSGGIRNAEKKFESIYRYVCSDSIIEAVSQYITGSPKLVRVILFNKTIENNWLVSWHQDKTVCVNKRFDQEGWGPWSIKDNVIHVQPPLDVLDNMITLRVHLDDSSVDNGCLKILPNSHSLGILSKEAIHEYVANNIPIECIANRRSALLIRPHLLHSSSKGICPSQRRVLHIEFSGYQLPAEIHWT